MIFAVRCSALQCVAVFCTYASVAVCFSSGPVFFFPAAHLCGKMSKKLSQLKKTLKIVAFTEAQSLFDYPP
jgi:hypothetical protein